MGWGNSIFPLLIVTPTGGFTGLFLYSPGPGPGNLIGSWTAAAGTDPFGNSYPAGINVTSGVLSGVTINAIAEFLNPGPLIVRGNAGLTFQFFTATGVNNWVAPAGVTSVQALCWGPGGNAGSGLVGGFGGGGGGGGEFAQEAAVAVTPANTYHATVGAPGSSTTFAGDVLTVTAHAGTAGVNGTAGAPGTGGLGGTGSTNSTHFNGGAGGNANNNPNSGGGGGGSGPSNSQAGNAGQASPSTGTGGPGGAAPAGTLAGGGAGGHGGVHAGGAGAGGVQPGGGGGGGGDGGGAAGAGANGQVLLIYSTGGVGTQIVLSSVASGVDPVTGTTYAQGITSIDPTFGDRTQIFGANVFVNASSVWNLNGASLDVTTVGSGLRVAEGSNSKQGTPVTLAAGSVVVANTSVTANSRITPLYVTPSANAGALFISALTVGTGFTIKSTNAADTSAVSYEIFEKG